MRIDKPCGPRCNCVSLIGSRGLEQLVAAGPESEFEQERTLRHWAVGRKLVLLGAPLERGEIHMGGQVGFSWGGKGIVKFMSAHGLERIAEAWSGITVIDNQGGERGLCGARGEVGDSRIRRGP